VERLDDGAGLSTEPADGSDLIGKGGCAWLLKRALSSDAEVAIRRNAMQTCGLAERVENGSDLASPPRSKLQIVLSADDRSPQRVFRPVVVQR
jgi:hypothetical protein